MISLPYSDPRQTDPLLKEILSTTKEAVVAEGPDGRVLAVNCRFLDLIGWRDSYTGQPLDDLISAWVSRVTNPRTIEEYFRLCRESSHAVDTRELQPNPGQVVEARYLVAAGSHGTSFRLWFFQEWRTSALAWVSHEIKNPLNAVLGFSELLTEALDERTASEAVRSSLRGLRIGAKHLQSVLGDLLDLSRLESGLVETRPEWVDLFQFLGDIDALFRTRHQRRGLEFVVEAPECPGIELWIDPGRLTQILGNLLSNSLRFTKRGWVALRVHDRGDSWEFVVEDSGVGVPLDQQETIFEPFVQKQGQNPRQYGGTGLGLAICRTLSQSLGGSLSLVSEPGHGSRFTVSFPGLKSRTYEGKCQDEETSLESSGVTLLVADDEKTNQLLVQGFLKGTSVGVIEALDGFQAVEVWKRRRPQVILMDLRMPGLSGLEAARRIRALDPLGSTKLLAMSATKPSVIELAEGLPLWSGYLEKPFSKQEILKFLSKHLTIVDDSAKSS